jgi:D-sedoheptulose 7-phosphate isomerase
MDINAYVKNHISEITSLLLNIQDELTRPIEQAVNIIINTFKVGNKLLIAGNGGSAADAQHIAAELIVRLSKDVKRPSLPAIALNTDTSILTAAGNDIGYENVFKRQLEGLGKPGDIFWAISTSGNSANLISAINYARQNKIKTIGLLGNDGGKMLSIVDFPLIVHDFNTQHIQEVHVCIYHIICELIEKAFEYK